MVAALVEEMVTREEEKLQAVIRHILVRLAKGYMDKVGFSYTTSENSTLEQNTETTAGDGCVAGALPALQCRTGAAQCSGHPGRPGLHSPSWHCPIPQGSPPFYTGFSIKDDVAEIQEHCKCNIFCSVEKNANLKK